MMIKIISKPISWTINCDCKCGWKFSFQIEDVKRRIILNSVEYKVVCPNCFKSLNVKNLLSDDQIEDIENQHASLENCLFVLSSLKN